MPSIAVQFAGEYRNEQEQVLSEFFCRLQIACLCLFEGRHTGRERTSNGKLWASLKSTNFGEGNAPMIARSHVLCGVFQLVPTDAGF